MNSDKICIYSYISEFNFNTSRHELIFFTNKISFKNVLGFMYTALDTSDLGSRNSHSLGKISS